MFFLYLTCIIKVKFSILIPLISNYLNVIFINYNHNSIQIELFSLAHSFIRLVAGVGEICSGSFIPHLHKKVRFGCSFHVF